jgi:hypothetical protein
MVGVWRLRAHPVDEQPVLPLHQAALNLTNELGTPIEQHHPSGRAAHVNRYVARYIGRNRGALACACIIVLGTTASIFGAGRHRRRVARQPADPRGVSGGNAGAGRGVVAEPPRSHGS